MEFKFVDELLRDKMLTLLPLAVLVDNGSLAKYALIQLSGMIEADHQGVRNSQQLLAHQKIQKFLSRTKSKSSELVVVPEYATPWTMLSEINEGLRPQVGAMWVLGFESITPKELEALTLDYANIKFIFRLPDPNGKVFLNPLLYVFWTKNSTNNHILVILIQFKTHPMTDTALQLERQFMILGSDVYIFRVENSIHLMSILCSDAQTFDPSQIAKPNNSSPGIWNLFPFILIHPQLNPSPSHLGFRKYRADWESAPIEKKQIICANWARGTIVNNQKPRPDQFGKSAIYFKEKFIENHNQLVQNHKKGMYYARTPLRAHTFYLNFDEHIFEFNMCKVLRTTIPNSSANHPSPILENVCVWRDDWLDVQFANDEYLNTCRWLSDNRSAVLTKSSSLDVLQKEILINISTGAYSIEPFGALTSVEVTASEDIRRLTFRQDQSNESRNYISYTIGKFDDLCWRILQQPSELPPFLRSAENLQLELLPYGYNLSSRTGAPAVVSFIGSFDGIGPASIEFERIQSVISPENSRRICVWYKKENEFLKVFDANNSIDHTTTSLSDIAGEM